MHQHIKALIFLLITCINLLYKILTPIKWRIFQQKYHPPALFCVFIQGFLQRYIIWTCVCFIIAVRLPTESYTHHHTVTLKLPYKNIKVAETSARSYSHSQGRHHICAASKTFKTKFIAQICVHLRSAHIYASRRRDGVLSKSHTHSQTSLIIEYSITIHTMLHALISCFTPSRAYYLYIICFDCLLLNVSLAVDLNETEHRRSFIKYKVLS